ncbi:heterokaryon incompatibility protein-domain-containing protein, partial [Clohesyomyces aquaticus]
PLEDDEIRLVILQSKTETDTIECHMVYETFDTAIQNTYEALSYTWVSPNSPRLKINMDDATCKVRENLWWALYHLRREKEVRRIWIDALCINQADANERNHQVSQMGRIYSEAECVDVWLGRASVEDANAFESLRHLGRNAPFGSSRISKVDWFSSHQDRWQDIKNLSTRAYWTRLWIIQEFALAKRICLYYDNMIIDEREMCDTIVELEDIYVEFAERESEQKLLDLEMEMEP